MYKEDTLVWNFSDFWVESDEEFNAIEKLFEEKIVEDLVPDDASKVYKTNDRIILGQGVVVKIPTGSSMKFLNKSTIQKGQEASLVIEKDQEVEFGDETKDHEIKF